MARTGPYLRHFLRQWRGERTLEDVIQLCKELDEPYLVTHWTLSRVERGLVPYSQPMLEALAKVYGETPGTLLDVDPNTDILQHDPELRAQARRALSRR